MKAAQPTQNSALEKSCTKCQEAWPADTEFFHREPRNADGLTGECIACKSHYDSWRYGSRFTKPSGRMTQSLQGVFTAMIQKKEQLALIE